MGKPRKHIARAQPQAGAGLVCLLMSAQFFEKILKLFMNLAPHEQFSAEKEVISLVTTESGDNNELCLASCLTVPA